MQELRLRAAKRTACARAQVTWLRETGSLKLGKRTSSARSAAWSCTLPTATPDLHAWRHIRPCTRRPRRIGPSQRPCSTPVHCIANGAP